MSISNFYRVLDFWKCIVPFDRFYKTQSKMKSKNCASLREVCIPLFRFFAGYLWCYLCNHDMASDFVCWVCCDDGNAAAQPLPSLQYNKYIHIPNICIPGICITFKSNVYRPSKFTVCSLVCMLHNISWEAGCESWSEYCMAGCVSGMFQNTV